MNLEQNVCLGFLKEESFKNHNSTLEQLNNLHSDITGRLEGNNNASILRKVIIPAIYILCTILVFMAVINNSPMYSKIHLTTLITSIIFFGVLTIRQILRMKYYRVILVQKDRLMDLHSRVSMGKSGLTVKLDNFNSQSDRNWDLQLQPAESIPEAISDIQHQLHSTSALESGLVNGLCTMLYYISAVLWTISSSLFIMTISSSFIYSYDWGETVAYLCVFIACVAECFVAAKFYSMSNCTVTNTTVLALPLGMAMYLGALLAAAIVAGIIYLIIGLLKIVAILIALALGGAIVSAFMSGG